MSSIFWVLVCAVWQNFTDVSEENIHDCVYSCSTLLQKVFKIIPDYTA
jgi:hypothetical protein